MLISVGFSKSLHGFAMGSRFREWVLEVVYLAGVYLVYYRRYVFFRYFYYQYTLLGFFCFIWLE